MDGKIREVAQTGTKIEKASGHVAGSVKQLESSKHTLPKEEGTCTTAPELQGSSPTHLDWGGPSKSPMKVNPRTL